MKISTLSLIAFVLLSCNETKKTDKKPVEMQKMVAVEKANYPAEIVKIFQAHGGLDKWNTQKTLGFIKPNDEGFEHYTIDLKTRNEKVVSENIERGYEGNKTWILDPENNFKGDALFYKNLYFYFYAMPFVFADKGINFSAVDNLEVNGASYPGVKISYNDGVGSSSKDEYYLHYDPATNVMVWLGYTVTYRTGEKSDKISWIHYEEWMDVSGLKLPKSIIWHKVEDNVIKEAVKTVVFENVTLSDKSMENGYYAKPESATFIETK